MEPLKTGQKAKSPPYIAYKTFIGFVDSLRKAIPGRIDRSVMHTMSGGTQSHMTHALRTMDLVTDSGIPTESFKALIMSQGEDRKKAIQECLRVGYPFLFAPSSIDLETATGKQMLEAFDNCGLRGDSIRRSIAFFLAAAKEAGLKTSPYFIKIQSRSGGNLNKARNGEAAPDVTETTEGATNQSNRNGQKGAKLDPKPPISSAGAPWAELLLAKFPAFDPDWTDEVKTRWFDAFDKLMGSQPK